MNSNDSSKYAINNNNNNNKNKVCSKVVKTDYNNQYKLFKDNVYTNCLSKKVNNTCLNSKQYELKSIISKNASKKCTLNLNINKINSVLNSNNLNSNTISTIINTKSDSNKSIKNNTGSKLFRCLSTDCLNNSFLHTSSTKCNSNKNLEENKSVKDLYYIEGDSNKIMCKNTLSYRNTNSEKVFNLKKINSNIKTKNIKISSSCKFLEFYSTIAMESKNNKICNSENINNNINIIKEKICDNKIIKKSKSINYNKNNKKICNYNYSTINNKSEINKAYNSKAVKTNSSVSNIFDIIPSYEINNKCSKITISNLKKIIHTNKNLNTNKINVNINNVDAIIKNINKINKECVKKDNLLLNKDKFDFINEVKINNNINNNNNKTFKNIEFNNKYRNNYKVNNTENFKYLSTNKLNSKMILLINNRNYNKNVSLNKNKSNVDLYNVNKKYSKFFKTNNNLKNNNISLSRSKGNLSVKVNNEKLFNEEKIYTHINKDNKSVDLINNVNNTYKENNLYIDNYLRGLYASFLYTKNLLNGTNKYNMYRNKNSCNIQQTKINSNIINLYKNYNKYNRYPSINELLNLYNIKSYESYNKETKIEEIEYINKNSNNRINIYNSIFNSIVDSIIDLNNIIKDIKYSNINLNRCSSNVNNLEYKTLYNNNFENYNISKYEFNNVNTDILNNCVNKNVVNTYALDTQTPICVFIQLMKSNNYTGINMSINKTNYRFNYKKQKKYKSLGEKSIDKLINKLEVIKEEINESNLSSKNLSKSNSVNNNSICTKIINNCNKNNVYNNQISSNKKINIVLNNKIANINANKKRSISLKKIDLHREINFEDNIFYNNKNEKELFISSNVKKSNVKNLVTKKIVNSIPVFFSNAISNKITDKDKENSNTIKKKQDMCFMF